MIRWGFQYLNINRHYFICNVCIALCVLHTITSSSPKMDFVLPYLLFSPHFHSFLLSYVFHPTILVPSLLLSLFLHPPCPGIIPAVPSRDYFPHRHNEISQSSPLPHAHASARDASGTYPQARGHGVRPEVPAINHHYRAFS